MQFVNLVEAFGGLFHFRFQVAGAGLLERLLEVGAGTEEVGRGSSLALQGQIGFAQAGQRLRHLPFGLRLAGFLQGLVMKFDSPDVVAPGGMHLADIVEGVGVVRVSAGNAEGVQGLFKIEERRIELAPFQVNFPEVDQGRANGAEIADLFADPDRPQGIVHSFVVIGGTVEINGADVGQGRGDAQLVAQFF